MIILTILVGLTVMSFDKVEAEEQDNTGETQDQENAEDTLDQENVEETQDQENVEETQDQEETVLKIGDNNEETKELKENLIKLGFNVGMNYPTSFGPSTESTVKEFQEYYGLDITGMGDETTLAKVESTLNSSLRRGQNNDETRKLKEDLIKIGFEVGMNFPTSYGPSTESTVKEFQEYYELKVNGIGDSVTLRKLDELVNSPLELGLRAPIISEINEQLMELSYDVSSNDYFSSDTEKAIKDIQEYYSLEVTGIADEETLEKLDLLLDNPLRLGQNSEEAAILKENLNKLGFHVSMNFPTSYGPSTERTVKEFQDYFGLPVTGIGDEKTLAKVQETLNSPLRRGQNNNETADMKEKLNKLGFSVGMNYPTSYGPSTESTVKEFQEYYGLKVNGIGDTVTLPKLNEVVNSFLEPGSRSPKVYELNTKLIELFHSIPEESMDTFGSATEKALSDFQNGFGLEVTGLANEETLNKLDEIISNPLRRGQNSEEAAVLKEKLNQIGFEVSMNYPTSYGPSTEKTVKEFQKYYSLNVNGIGDEATLAKVEEIRKSSLRRGQSNEETAELKENLNKIGFIVSMNSPTSYGPSTEKTVKEFQKYYGLVVNGIGDQVTLDKLNDVSKQKLSLGLKRPDVLLLKLDLSEVGFHISDNPTDYYGNTTKSVVKDFQKLYGIEETGVANEETLAKLKELMASPLRQGKNNSETIQLKEKLNQLGFHVSMNYPDSFGPSTKSTLMEFQEYYGLIVNGIGDTDTMNKMEEIFNSSLRLGQSNEKTAELKEDLIDLGFELTMNSPNSYGSLTERTVKQFQRYYGLRINGIGDEVTLAKIEEILNSSLRRGQNNNETAELKQNLNKLGFEVGMNFPNSYGPSTEETVRDFQFHYRLRVNGIGDSVTLAKIDEILNSPYQNGKSHSDMKDFKRKLNDIGYGGINITDYFGDFTERRVKEFQTDMELPVSGILDEITIEVLNRVYERQPVFTRTSYDISLNDAFNIQMGMSLPPQTDRYRNNPGFVRTSDLDIFESGQITGSSVNVRTEPDSTKDNIETSLTNGTKFEYIETVRGNSVGGNRDWYKMKYSGKTLYVHSSLSRIDGSFAKVKTATNVYETGSTSSHLYYRTTSGKEYAVREKGSTWTQLSVQTWRNAKRADAFEFFDPEKQDNFQHLVLSSSPNVSSNQINRILEDQGILSGKGQAFIDGGRNHGVNEIYLIAHAFLETNRGKSELATGIRVGKNSSGTLVLETERNKDSLSDTKTTYNMFGIGAFDGDAHRAGAVRAYELGWFTPEAAIRGGAKFIGERYIHNRYGQDTLYKMRWNPANPGFPQYASDMGWAAKQVATIKNMYDRLDQPMMVFDIPKYK